MFDKILIANRGEIALRVMRAAKELGIATVAVYSTADKDAMHVKLADESVCIGPPPAATAISTSRRIVAACEITGADAVHPGLRLPVRERPLRRNSRRARDRLHRPEGRAYPPHGRQDRGQAHGGAARHPLRAGLRGRDRRRGRGARGSPRRSAIPCIVKAAAGGGGRGMKVAHDPGGAGQRHSQPPRSRPRRPSATTPSISRNISKSPATSRSRCSATARAAPSTSASATARCSAATRRCWEEGPSPALNAEQRDEIGGVVARAMARTRLCRRRHDRVPVRGRPVLLHRDEHPHPGRASGDRDDHRHRHRQRADQDRRRLAAVDRAGGRAHSRRGDRMPGQRRARRAPSSPRPAGSPISTRRAASACASIRPAYQGYVIPPYYDSLVGKLIVHGRTRTEALMRLQARARRVHRRRHRHDAAAVPRAGPQPRRPERPVRHPLARGVPEDRAGDGRRS